MGTMACVAPAIGAQGQQPPHTELMPGAADWLSIAGAKDAAAALIQPLVSPMAVLTESTQGRQEQSPRTCRDLLAVEGDITGTVSEPDWADLRLVLARCHALQALSQAKQSVHTALPATLQALRATRLWPVDAWPAISPDEEQALKRPGLSLQNASGITRWHAPPSRKGTPKAERPIVWVLTTDVQIVTVQWIARGDFNGDGTEDWLLLWRAKASAGSWHDTRAARLTRTRKNEALTLHWLDASTH